MAAFSFSRALLLASFLAGSSTALVPITSIGQSPRSSAPTTTTRSTAGNRPSPHYVNPLSMSESTTEDQRVANIEDPPVEEGSQDELMYSLGVNLARQLGDIRPLVHTGEELAAVAKGLLDTVIGRLTEDGQRELLARRGVELNELITTRANSIREQMEASGREMLRTMTQTEGVQILPSGVVLHVLENGPEGGEGVRPTQASTVKIQYHGTLSDGTVFDSTLGGDPVAIPLAGVIAGWREGVLKMHEGETAMVGIPPEQAYGADGTPDGTIPGGSTLFFKVELLEVMSAGIGGGPKLVGRDGNKLGKKSDKDSGLLGADGKPLF